MLPIKFKVTDLWGFHCAHFQHKVANEFLKSTF